MYVASIETHLLCLFLSSAICLWLILSCEAYKYENVFYRLSLRAKGCDFLGSVIGERG